MSLIVSVSGIRGIVGETLTPAVALEFAQAYGTFLRAGRERSPRLLLARDTRQSGEMLAAAVAAGLLSTGCEVTQLGVAMTPAIGFAIREGKFDGGISITASHNPGQWNGLKLLDELGLAPDPQRAANVADIRASRRFHQAREGFNALSSDMDAGARHARAVLDAMEVDCSRLRAAFARAETPEGTGFRVVLDSINGAGCRHTPGFLEAIGCTVIHINGEPNGRFAHTPEPTAENLTQLCQAVREHRAAIGFAQDPDADRLAIVDQNGDYIGEEYTLALATRSVLSRRPGPVAANLSTSRMIDDIAAAHGVPVFRTPVGEAYVARAMLRHGCVIGGEGNGGVIDPRISPVRDSLSAISHVLQLIAATGKSAAELVADVPRYAMLKEKFASTPEAARSCVSAARAAFAGEPGVRMNDADGVRIDAAAGWVHVRASNTEPIVRVIAEAADEATCRGLIGRVREAAGL